MTALIFQNFVCKTLWNKKMKWHYFLQNRFWNNFGVPNSGLKHTGFEVADYAILMEIMYIVKWQSGLNYSFVQLIRSQTLHINLKNFFPNIFVPCGFLNLYQRVNYNFLSPSINSFFYFWVAFDFDNIKKEENVFKVHVACLASIWLDKFVIGSLCHFTIYRLT